MTTAAPLDYSARCERYARQRGWAYDEHRMSIRHLTPRQRRRALKKENQASRGELHLEYYADIDHLGEPVSLPWTVSYVHDDEYEYYDGQDPHDLGYCVTRGCNCCGDDDD